MTSRLAALAAPTRQLAIDSDRLMGQLQAQDDRVDTLRAEIEALTADIALVTLTNTALGQLLHTVAKDSVGTIEQLVTYGLQTVFPDQLLGFRLDVRTRGHVNWMEPRLVVGAVDAPILDAFGGGPASIVAFLLRVMVCRQLKLAPVLLLDEPFAFVSHEYVAAVGKLLRQLTEQLGLTILLVTHDPGYLPYAHRAYEATAATHGTVFKARDGSLAA